AGDGKMKTRHFLKALDDERIAEAIRRAENRTSGEIRVFISSRRMPGKPVLERAAAQFAKSGMAATLEHNGVLIYLVPEIQQFAIFGDAGIHGKCGDGFWSEIAEGLRSKMKAGDFSASIIEAVSAIGEALATYFPKRPDDRNELPDTVGSD
ncbi:MAG: TPM domain-containing protein, partial [Terrimicrobiaceae bacterium]